MRMAWNKDGNAGGGKTAKRGKRDNKEKIKKTETKKKNKKNAKCPDCGGGIFFRGSVSWHDGLYLPVFHVPQAGVDEQQL